MTIQESQEISEVTPETKVDRVRLVELLGSMRLDEERGAVWELMQCIDRCAQMFAEAEDVELREEFDEISRRAPSAVAFEAEHGWRSLFNHDHPLNKMLDEAKMIDLKSYAAPSPESGAFWATYFGHTSGGA